MSKSKPNQPKYGVEPKYILMLCTALCLILIFISYKFSSFITPVKSRINSLLVPMQKGITTVTTGIDNYLTGVRDVNTLKKQNSELQDEITELKNRLDTYEQNMYDLEEYKQLLELSETYSQYTTVGANIIAKDSSGYFATFTLDKGSADGLKVDMNVIADNGLVGIITEVGKNYSIVQSIIDDNSYVAAKVLKTSDECVICGNLSLLDTGFINVTDLSINSEVKNNYKVYTSDLSEKYLPDIFIGYISDIKTEADGLSKSGYLTPVVDFEHLSTVLVIKELKSEISPAEEEEEESK